MVLIYRISICFNFTDSVEARSSTIDGILAVNVDKRRITIARSGGSIINEGVIIDDLTLSEIKNPSVSGPTGVFVVATTTSIVSEPIDMRENVISQNIVPGVLSTVAVTPISMTAGATTNALVSFTTSNGNAVPADGQIIVTFPSGFNLTGVTSVSSASDVNGILDIQSGIEGQTITISRLSNGTIISGGSIIDDLIIQNVRNPQISGNTDTFVVQTATSTGSLIDVNESVSSVKLTPGAITSASIVSTFYEAGASASVYFDFEVTNPIPADGKIIVTFPTSTSQGNFDLSNVEFSGGILDGSFSVTVDNNKVTIVRSSGTTTPAGTTIDNLILQNVVNPPKSGTTGNFIIRTQDSNGVDIDSNSAITGVDIIPGNLYRANEISTNPPLIEFSNLQINTEASATLSFRTKNDIPGSGQFKIEFPTGFNVVDGIKILSTELGINSLSLMNSADSNTNNRVISVGTSTIPGNTTVNIYFEKIGLPRTAGAVNNIKIQTLDDSSGDMIVIDQSTTITGPTILNTGTVTSNGLAISNLTAGGDQSVEFDFYSFSKIGKSNTIELTTSPGIFGSVVT